MRACLESVGDHAAWLLDPLLAVHDVARWQNIEEHARVRYLDRTADLKDAVDIIVANLAIGVGDGNLAARVLTLDVVTGDGDGGVLNVIAGEALCGIDGGANRSARLLDVGDHSLAHPLVRVGPLTNDADGAVLATNVRDGTRNLRGADIDCGDRCVALFCHLVVPSTLCAHLAHHTPAHPNAPPYLHHHGLTVGAEGLGDGSEGAGLRLGLGSAAGGGGRTPLAV